MEILLNDEDERMLEDNETYWRVGVSTSKSLRMRRTRENELQNSQQKWRKTYHCQRSH